MTTTKKILAATLVCTIPLGVFAYDKYERHGNKYDRDDYKKSSYDCDKHEKYDNKYFEMDDDFEDISYEFIEKTGANLGFEGTVQLKPKEGFNGIWTVAGKEVIVDDNTVILMEEDIKITDEVAILAKRENGKIKAILIEED